MGSRRDEQPRHGGTRMENPLPASSGTSVGCAAGRLKDRPWLSQNSDAQISPAGPTTVTRMEKNDDIKGKTVVPVRT